MIRTESVHAICTTARTIVLETLPLGCSSKEKHGPAAVIVSSSESGGVKCGGFDRINVAQRTFKLVECQVLPAPLAV
jgi:uncharacterized protein YodC (DUF2158 family)